jgi:outer membrane protein TolC
MKFKNIIIIFFSFFNTVCFAQPAKTLDYYLDQALKNSPLLKDFGNRLISNSIDSQRLKASFRPQVNAVANNSWFPIINGYGYDPALSNIAAFNELVNVNQAFIGHKNLNTQYNSIHLTGDSLTNEQKISEQDLRRTITAQYIATYGDLQQLNFNMETNKILRNQEAILKKLAENNIYRQTDYLTFFVTLQQQELQMKQLRIQFQTNYATLNYLCGIFDTTSAELAEPNIPLQYSPDISASIFFSRFVTDSLLRQNDIAILNYSYRPKLNAFASAGFSSSFTYDAYKNFGTGVGFGINVPIYDGHQKRMLTQKIKLLMNTNSDYRDFFARQYNQQLAMLQQQLSSTQSLISEINEQIVYSQGLIDVNGKLLQTGDAKISDYVIAINNYLAAKNLLTQNNISRLQIINQINYWNR